MQSFLLDVELMYASRKGTLTNALQAAKSFSCKTCPHKPSSPFPPFPSNNQLEVRKSVKVKKFVPRPRPNHMTSILFFISSLLPYSFFIILSISSFCHYFSPSLFPFHHSILSISIAISISPSLSLFYSPIYFDTAQGL
jgi:hypothetical protein